MAFTNKLQKIVHQPIWQWSRFSPTANTAVSAMCSQDDGGGRYLYYLVAATFYRYDTWSNSWIQLATPPTAALTFVNMSYTQYGGNRGRVIARPSSTTLQVPALFGQMYNGYTIRIISGAGQGQEKVITAVAEATKHEHGFCTTAAAASIADSTKKWKLNQWSGYSCRLQFGAGVTQIRKILYNDTTTLYFYDTNHQPIDPWNNTGWATTPVNTSATPSMYAIESQVVTTSSWTTAPDYTSRFVLLSGGIWLLSSAAAGAFYTLQYYDVITDTWFTRTASTGLVLAAFGTDSSIERTGEVGGQYANGTTSGAGGAFTLPNVEAQTVDRWRNYQIRITGGTGIGQRRRIVCNSANSIEVNRRWDTVPAADTNWAIYADTDNIWWVGGAKSSIFQYNVEEDLPVQSAFYDGGIANDLASQMAGWKPIAVTSATKVTTAIQTITAVPANKGTGYKVGDILTLADGTNGKVIVETISGSGLVETVSLIAIGSGYTVATHNATGGSGSSCTVAVTANMTGVRVVTAINHFYKVGDVITFSGASEGGYNTTWTIAGVDGIAAFDIPYAATSTASASNANAATLLVDTTKTWVVNEHTGKILQTHLVGTAGVMLARRITSNTATTITMATITTAAANGTGRYMITDISAFGREGQYEFDTLSNEGHASSGGDTYLVDSSKTWFGNQWNGYKVRIIAGTGRGKELTITSSTNNQLNYASSGVTPDATSHYIIMDTFGMMTTGSGTTITDTFKNWNFTGTTNMFDGKSVRIIAGTGLGQEALVTGGTATTLTVANGTAPDTTSVYCVLDVPVRGAGIKILWIFANTEQASVNKGKWLFIPTGGGSNRIDRYDITTEKVKVSIATAPFFETFTTGSMWQYDAGNCVYFTKDFTARLYRYSFLTGLVDQIGQHPYPAASGLIGNRMEVIVTTDGLKFVYLQKHGSTEMFRTLVFW